ncbi:Ubiquitin conjugation factor E4 [Rhodotorula sphaerocarpa]
MADHAELRDVLSRQFQSWNSRLQAVLRLSDPAVAARDATLVGQSIVTLTACKKLAALVPGLPTWCSAPAGRDAVSLERHSLLGPLLRLGAGPDSSAFPSLEVVSLAAFADYRNARRQEFHPVEDLVYQVAVHLLRSDAREEVVSYFALIASLNKRRAALAPDHSALSSAALLGNVHLLFMRLADPIINQFERHAIIFGAQLPKVQAEYYDLFAALRVDLGDETRIGDEPAVQSSQAETPHFVSDVLFLGAYFAHVALLPTIRQRSRALDEGERLQQEYARVDSGVHWRGTPQHALVKSALAELQVKMLAWQQYQVAVEVQLLDPRYLGFCASFCRLALVWLLRLADPEHQHPGTRLALPLPDRLPAGFLRLPEFFITDTFEVLAFINTSSSIYSLSIGLRPS